MDRIFRFLYNDIINYYVEPFLIVFFCTVLVLRIWRYIMKCRTYENDDDLTGTTVIVTGASSGIGKETAFILAKKGAKVIMACRNLEKGIQAVNEFRQTCLEGTLSVEHLDLASFESIRLFAKTILKTERHIDILINNAGLLTNSSLTADDVEIHFGVNYLGHFLLTELLLERLKESAPARIINVTSHVHFCGTMNWPDLQLRNFRNRSIVAYFQSKLALVIYTKELARRLQGSGVTVYAVLPGTVRTDITRHLATLLSYPSMIVITLIRFISGTVPFMGAQTTVYCALDESLDNESGNLYTNCRRMNSRQPAIYNEQLTEEACRLLWVTSERLTRQQR